MPMLSSASSAALNWKRFKRVRLPIRERWGEFPLSLPLPCPHPYSPRGALDAALRYILLNLPLFWSQGLCLGLSRLHDLPLEFAGLGRFMAARQPAYPDGRALNCSLLLVV